MGGNWVEVGSLEGSGVGTLAIGTEVGVAGAGVGLGGTGVAVGAAGVGGAKGVLVGMDDPGATAV